MVSNMLMTHNKESEAAPKFLNLFMKKKTGNLERLGDIIIHQNKTKVYWDKSKMDEKEKNVTEKTEKNHGAPRSNNNISYMFRELLKKEDERQSGCATAVKEIKVQETDNEATQVLVSGMSDNEWWTMVAFLALFYVNNL